MAIRDEQLSLLDNSITLADEYSKQFERDSSQWKTSNVLQPSEVEDEKETGTHIALLLRKSRQATIDFFNAYTLPTKRPHLRHLFSLNAQLHDYVKDSAMDSDTTQGVLNSSDTTCDVCAERVTKHMTQAARESYMQKLREEAGEMSED